MWAKDRHHRIVSLLSLNEHLSHERLIEELKVSRETLRRDIRHLEADGVLQRVHGGVVRIQGAEPPLQSRLAKHKEEKRRIGEAAARLVKPGMMCAIDAGSTTSAFAASLASVPDVSIVTNSIDVAMTIRAAQPGADVILLGGQIGADVPATYGQLAIVEMGQFLPQIAIFSPVAFSAEQGATSFLLPEAEFARAMIQRAERVVLLADHSKLGTTSRVQICKCDQIDVLITDRKASPKAVDELVAHGVSEAVRA